MPFEFALSTLLILFFAALVAGYMDTLAGGGGLITLPALMISGMPITIALGTNKLQSSFGSITASLVLLAKKKIVLLKVIKPLILALISGFIGAICVLWVDKSALKWLVASALILVIIYFSRSNNIIKESSINPIKVWFHTYIAVPIVGFYDGLLGPGTGSFFTAINLHFCGFGFLKATAYAKPLNAATNVAALAVFIFNDSVNWMAGIVMIAGQITGSGLAANRLHHYSPKFLRKLVIGISLLLLSSYTIRELM